MSKEPRQIFGHLDRHEVHRGIAISELDGDFNFKIKNDIVGSLVFRTPSRDLGVTPEAVIAAVEDHLLAFDPSRGETKLAVDALEQARKFLAAGRDFAKIVKIEMSDGKIPKAESKPKSKGSKPVDNSKEK